MINAFEIIFSCVFRCSRKSWGLPPFKYKLYGKGLSLELLQLLPWPARAHSHKNSLQDSGYSDLKFLCFRQNLLADASAITRGACKQSLEELYMNDNHLKEIPDLTGFEKLRRLEFSYNHEVHCKALSGSVKIIVCHVEICEKYVSHHLNAERCHSTGNSSALSMHLLQIRSLKPLEHVEGANMVELYSAENKISAIEAISHLTNLTILELGSNRIKVRSECL
jgi:hypothetical protein